MRSRIARGADASTFWLSFFYWGGLAGALAFSAYIYWVSSSHWFTEASTTTLLFMVFLGVLLFIALASVLLLVNFALRGNHVVNEEYE